jgi:hypothetical protein
MTLSNPAPTRQLPLQWDAEPRTKPEHLAEWTTGSAVSPAVAELALESIAGWHQVLGFLKPWCNTARPQVGYGPVPMNKKAKAARTTFERPCRGGWLASGHAPIEGGVLVPVTFKPDYPRIGQDRKPIKYERPAGSRPVPFFAPLDAGAYEAIAARAGLTPPPFVSSWSAWCWLLAQPAVELCIDEGEKKGAAACSHGWLTIGLAGIWNGCPKPKNASGQPFGAPTLVAELAWLRSIRPGGAPITIAFDASDKPRGRVAIRKARRTLGRLLLEHGHQVRIREMLQPAGADFIKGTDDLLVHNGADALAALPVMPFDQWLKATSQQAISDHLLQPFKTEGRKHRTIARHFKASDLPDAELVALIGGMGSNKTGAMAGSTDRLVSITHRRSLADNQGMRFGLAVKREGQVLHALEQSQADLRQVGNLLADHEGFVTVADSSYIGGSGELTPDLCSGAVLFIDEADAFLRHCLTSQTAIAKHRCEVLANLAACVAAASRVVLAGAHIDETTLQAFETMRGNGAKAHIIESTLQPAGGRSVTLHRKVEDLLQQMRNLASRRRPFVFHTGSKQTSSKMAPANLARLVRRWWPDARILEMTAETIRDPNHPAAAAIEDPQRLLAFDVVLASPVLETGFSIEDPQQHFAAVLGHTSGHTLPQAFVQSLGRLRSPVQRHIWCSASGSRIGNGAPVVDELERCKLDHAEAVARLHLVDAGEACGDAGRCLRWWSELAADQNWLAAHYRHAVAVLLEREGYAVDRRDLLGSDTGTELVDELTEARDETVAIETAAVAATPAPDAKQLEQLESRQRLTADERRTIERGSIARDFGIAKPTAEQVAASRNGSYGKLLQHLLVVDANARKQWQQKAVANLTPSQRRFAPDTTKALAPGTRATALAQMPWLLELLDLADTGKTVIGFDFERHHEAAKADRLRWRELFGFDPTSGTVRTFMASTLALLGFKLQRTSRRQHAGDRIWWAYEVVDDLAVLDRRKVLQHLAFCHFPCK